MSEKFILKKYTEFKGLDLSQTHLSRDKDAAIKCENLEVAPTGSLETRKGFKAAAQHWASSGGTTENTYPFLGLENYKYTDINTGELKEIVVGVGNNLYKLTGGSMTLSYGGAGTATFSVLPSTVSAQDWQADIKVNGVSQAGFPFSLGSGFDEGTSVRLSALRNAINALANFQCSLTPAAVVNGAQVNRGPAAAVTVFNAYSATTQPHTFTVSTTAPTRAEIFDRQPAPDIRKTVDVIAQTATTLTCKLPDPTATFDVSNNDEIGVGLYPAAILPITNALGINSAQTITFDYWERVYGPNQTDSIFTPTTWLNYPNFHNYVMKTHSNNIYIGMPFSIGSDPTNYYNFTSFYVLETPPRKTGLLKYDGQACYAAGLPRVGGAIFLAAAGGALAIGTYKYLVRYRHLDAQGNYSYSSDTLDYRKQVGDLSATTAGGNLQVSAFVVNAGADQALGTVHPYLNDNYARVNGNQAGVNTITVLAAEHFLRVGDWALLLNRVAAPATFVQRKVTAITNTTITIDGGVVTVNNTDVISGGKTAEIFRTKVGGNIFYKQSEQPCPSVISNLSFTDNTPDAALGIEYDGPFLGNRRKDLPPVMGIIENHQGLLVGAGDPENPETLYWSNFDSPEAWPQGTGQVDIGGDEGGALTCLISDRADMLAAFKEESYQNVVGDLDSGAYSITSYSEGGLGCPSPHGAEHFRESILFISNKGPRVLQAGQLLDYDLRLLPYFQNNDYTQVLGTAISSSDSVKLVLRRTILKNDKDSEQIFVFLPAESGTPGTSKTLRPNSNSKCFIYDYGAWLPDGSQGEPAWYERTTADSFSRHNLAGGMTVSKHQFYFIAREREGSALTTAGLLMKRNETGTKYDFSDNAVDLVSVYQPQWVFDEDLVELEFLRFKVFRFDSVPDANTATDYTLTLATYKNFATSAFDTQKAIQMVSGVDFRKTIKLKSNKAEAMLFELRITGSTNQIPSHQSARISAYQILLAKSYEPEDIMEKS